MTKGHNSPQNYNNDRQRQTFRIHEQVEQKDIHDHRTKKHQPQRHVAVHQQKHATGDLKRTYNQHVMRLKECTNELACQS